MSSSGGCGLDVYTEVQSTLEVQVQLAARGGD
jgi:hypothetical protein